MVLLFDIRAQLKCVGFPNFYYSLKGNLMFIKALHNDHFLPVEFEYAGDGFQSLSFDLTTRIQEFYFHFSGHLGVLSLHVCGKRQSARMFHLRTGEARRGGSGELAATACTWSKIPHQQSYRLEKGALMKPFTTVEGCYILYCTSGPVFRTTHFW